MVDYSTEVLDVYIYTESEGKKGGNYVVSSLQKSLERKGVFKEAENNKSRAYLTLVFDNCGGKSKNGMLLRYATVRIMIFKNSTNTILQLNSTELKFHSTSTRELFLNPQGS